MSVQKFLTPSDSSAEGMIEYGNYIAEATVEKLVFGGMGLLRDENIGVCFIYGVLPGERVRFRVSGLAPSKISSQGSAQKCGFQRAELLELLEVSKDRVEPKCVHYDQCGACDWQHISYKSQQDYKVQIVLENLQRLAQAEKFVGTASTDYEALIKPSIAEPEYGPSSTGLAGWAYRQRAKFFSLTKDEPYNLGFRRKASCDALAVPQCQILVPAIRQQLFTLSHNKEPLELGEESNGGIHVFASGQSCYWEEQEFSYNFQNIELKSQARLFFQSNAKVLPLLLEELQKDLKLILNDWQNKWSGKCGAFLDLYAGVGLFSSCFAQFLPASSQCYAIERNPRAFTYLQQNLARWHFDCRKEDVGIFLKKLSANNKDILERSIIFADPSRGGMSATVSRLLSSSGAEYIFYLSCDAASFARDYGRLCQAYLMESWRLVDFYPQTHHIEVLALLRRRPTP